MPATETPLTRAEILAALERLNPAYDSRLCSCEREVLIRALRELLERAEDTEFIAWLARVAPETYKSLRKAYARKEKGNG